MDQNDFKTKRKSDTKHTQKKDYRKHKENKLKQRSIPKNTETFRVVDTLLKDLKLVIPIKCTIFGHLTKNSKTVLYNTLYKNAGLICNNMHNVPGWDYEGYFEPEYIKKFVNGFKFSKHRGEMGKAKTGSHSVTKSLYTTIIKSGANRSNKAIVINIGHTIQEYIQYQYGKLHTKIHFIELKTRVYNDCNLKDIDRLFLSVAGLEDDGRERFYLTNKILYGDGRDFKERDCIYRVYFTEKPDITKNKSSTTFHKFLPNDQTVYEYTKAYVYAIPHIIRYV